MNDRELLEMAAKAAGYSGAWIKWPGARHPLDVELGFFHGSDWSVWNPLVFDGDALRLAVKLRLEIERSKHSECVVYVGEVGAGQLFERSDEKTDIFAATRRAIVRAAAEIGREMKE